MTGTLQSHRPEVLLLKDDPVHPRFQPGNTVSHVDDPQSWGMVLSRREEAGPIIDVLWSRTPVKPVRVHERPPRRQVPVPHHAVWTLTLERRDGRDPWRAHATAALDGDEWYGPGQLTHEDLAEMRHDGHSMEYVMHEDGSVSVRHRNVFPDRAPAYVGRAPPSFLRHYDHGRPRAT
jgi:hypothetical protein